MVSIILCGNLFIQNNLLIVSLSGLYKNILKYINNIAVKYTVCNAIQVSASKRFFKIKV